MPHILEMPCFKIKDGVSEADFLRAHEKFNREFMSKQKGYVSHSLIRNGAKWFDVAVWDSVASKQKAYIDIYKYDGIEEYMSFIDQEGTDDDIPLYTVVTTY
ncbi:hypothetical protein LPW36_05685 [Jinshanibacter sp. LJY008]|uniref:ABM domain-containing protein n=1 Tax=Limnobaculum eriocheiris TaxID=2897391 RepID=A0A9X1MWJ1_9GAMM|nr:hypothetical protein [Limnobaculum eriocheiris]MCD1125505.1 hypothetical protein [Limnobaculum eriocheiris]